MRKIFYLILFLLAGCTLYEKPKVPVLPNPQQFKAQVTVTDPNLSDQWWENFQDPELNQLVALAVKNNYNYKIALKNIQIACTYVAQNMSNLFPQVSAGFNASRNKSPTAISNLTNGTNNTVSATNPTSPNFSTIFNLTQLSGTATYQVDLWDQISNSVKQAEASEVVSEADSRGVKLTVISSVVSLYFQVKALNANIANLTKQLHATQEVLHLDKTQYKSGLIDYSVVDTAETQVELININLSSLRKQKQILDYTLAYLVGEYPENFSINIDKGFQNFSDINLIPEGIPAKMVANRPDIQDAYYQILSYGYIEKENIANFLPSVSLTAGYGYASTALGGLLSTTNSYWNVGLLSTQYIFDYESRMSIYERSKYQYQSAILNYKNVVLNAFEQVDAALTTYQEDDVALRAYQHQYGNLTDQVKLANAQYHGGLTNYGTYLTTDLSYLQADYNLTNQKLAVAQDVTQVYVTLGMGTHSHYK